MNSISEYGMACTLRMVEPSRRVTEVHMYNAGLVAVLAKGTVILTWREMRGCALP
jgi:hypothetical protein